MAKKLTLSQIAYIQKNLDQISSQEMAQKLSVPVKVIENFLLDQKLRQKGSDQLSVSSIPLKSIQHELWIQKISWPILSLIIGSVFIAISYYLVSKLNSFGFDDIDLAVYHQSFWNTLHGKFNYSSILDCNLLGYEFSLWNIISTPIYYLLGQTSMALLFWQVIGLLLVIIPLFLIAKKQINSLFGILFCFLYLFNPVFGFMSINEYHPESWIIFFYVWAFYFYEKENFKGFLWMLICSLLVKENQGLGFLGFALWAKLEKRTSKWIGVSCMGLIYFLFVLLMMEKIGPGSDYSAHFSYLGQGFKEIIQNLLLRPGLMVDSLFQKTKWIYLNRMVAPFSYLMFFHPLSFLVALPDLLINMVSDYRPRISFVYQFNGSIVATFCVSSIYGFKWIYLKLKHNKWLSYSLIFVFLFSFYKGISLGPWSQVQYLKSKIDNDNFDQIKKKYVSSIPKQASVIATTEFLPQLSNRKQLESFHYVVKGFRFDKDDFYPKETHAQYALIDFDDTLLKSFYNPHQYQNIRNFFEYNSWEKLKNFNGLFLFKKTTSDQKYHFISEYLNVPENESNYHQLEIVFGKNIIWHGYMKNTINTDAQKGIQYVCYFEAKEKPEFDYHIVFWVYDEQMQLIDQIEMPLTFYQKPTSHWDIGSKYQIEYQVVPRQIPLPNKYFIKSVLFNGWVKRGVSADLSDDSPVLDDNKVPLS